MENNSEYLVQKNSKKLWINIFSINVFVSFKMKKNE